MPERMSHYLVKYSIYYPWFHQQFIYGFNKLFSMKRKITIILVSFLLTTVAFAGLCTASNGNDGSAPNSGDGVPDGSGYDSPNGPNGNDDSGNGNDGPAPNSGDGVSDGPGW